MAASENERETSPVNMQQLLEQCHDTIVRYYLDAEIDGRQKNEIIEQQLKAYLENAETQEPAQAYTRFLSLLIRLSEFDANVNAAMPGSQLAVQLFTIFDLYLEDMGLLDRQNVHAGLFHGMKLVRRGLQIVSEFKTPKYLPHIERVFLLKDERMTGMLVSHVKEMFGENHFKRALCWIKHFDLHPHFSLEEVVCLSVITNQVPLLEDFIGDKLEYRKQTISFLDNLIELDLYNRPVATLPTLQRRLYDETHKDVKDKRLEKLTIKLLKAYEFPDNTAPNLLTLRAKNALLYEHWQFRTHKTAETHYLGMVFQILTRTPFLQQIYTSQLCSQGELELALFWAVMMNLEENAWPASLSARVRSNPRLLENARQRVQE
jgi:hypothetical protein